MCVHSRERLSKYLELPKLYMLMRIAMTTRDDYSRATADHQCAVSVAAFNSAECTGSVNALDVALHTSCATLE